MKDEDPLNPNQLPSDAPFLSVRDVAILFRTTPAAIRKAIETKDDPAKGTKADLLGSKLKTFLVSVTPHRRLFDRKGLMEWIRKNLPPPAESA